MSNFQPIIPLSILREILAAVIMNRVCDKMDRDTPISQAANRKGRSTTVHGFAEKTVIERTINSKNETVYLTLLDMSKAFDSIRRKDLIENLQNTVDADELLS